MSQHPVAEAAPDDAQLCRTRERARHRPARGRRRGHGHPQHHAALRRRDRDPRCLLRHPRARGPRHHRAERRGQVLDAQCHQRLLPSAGGRDLVPRAQARAHPPPPDRAPGDRAHLPEHRAVQGDDDARQHHDRAADQDAAQHALAGALGRPGRGRGDRASRGGREDHRLPRDPGTSARRRSGACPTACRSASSSAARSPPSPRCCCSTSRWRA